MGARDGAGAQPSVWNWARWADVSTRPGAGLAVGLLANRGPGGGGDDVRWRLATRRRRAATTSPPAPGAMLRRFCGVARAAGADPATVVWWWGAGGSGSLSPLAEYRSDPPAKTHELPHPRLRRRYQRFLRTAPPSARATARREPAPGLHTDGGGSNRLARAAADGRRATAARRQHSRSGARRWVGVERGSRPVALLPPLPRDSWRTACRSFRSSEMAL